MLKNQVDILNGCQNANKATIETITPRAITHVISIWLIRL